MGQSACRERFARVLGTIPGAMAGWTASRAACTTAPLVTLAPPGPIVYNDAKMSGRGGSEGAVVMTGAGGAGRRCPWCDSTDVETVQRGFAGKTDGNDQYFRCRTCGKTTWEMVSKTAQEVRLGRYEAGKSSPNVATAILSARPQGRL